MSNLLTVAHLSWAIWANHSHSLIWFERNERMSDERTPSPDFLLLVSMKKCTGGQSKIEGGGGDFMYFCLSITALTLYFNLFTYYSWLACDMATLFGKANMPLIGNNVRYADSVQWRIPGKLARGPSERVYVQCTVHWQWHPRSWEARGE